jgi:eukaryotic-like serine/threonine-protein kinase
MVDIPPCVGRSMGATGQPRLVAHISMENLDTKRFGRYEIVAELGRGAMGVVYKARDPQIDRLVALKTVSLPGQEPDQEAEYRQRFLHEAQAAGRLHHPGIVGVFDVGEDPENHNPYIVLEYVGGESLNRVLARERKLPPQRALQLALEIAEALDYAHAQGVVHRDIKPGNIMVTVDGRAKIADFGIAKLNLAHFTIPGRVLGTPAYMAPEQLSGEGADGRSDLFSLGVIIYAMVTGHSPFQGDSATTVCFKVVNRDPVPASSFELDLPRGLDEVIFRAMAKEPAERYQRGAELASDLRQLMQQRAPGSTTTSLSAVVATAGTGSSKAKAPGSSAPPITGLLHAQQLVWTAIRKASVRDLIAGAALVLLLIIVGIPAKQAGTSQKASVAQEAPSASHPEPSGVSSQPASPDLGADGANAKNSKVTASAGPSVSSIGKARKSSATTSAHPKLSLTAASHPSQTVVPNATLDLAVQHQFKDATLTVWVDDKLALTRPLHGGTQKRLVVFNGVRGIESETLQVPAGSHALRLQTTTADQTINLSKTTSAKFMGGDQKTLHITFDKHNTTMRLSWE